MTHSFPTRRSSDLTERGAGLRPRPTIFSSIVYLAIVAQHISAVRGNHRLVSGCREIDDGKAAMAKSDAGLSIGPASAVIRPPMDQTVGHVPRQRLETRTLPGRPEQTGYATHERTPAIPLACPPSACRKHPPPHGPTSPRPPPRLG